MIKEDYVSLEVAKMLQEKGFEEICHVFWWQHNTEVRLETRPFSFTKGWLEARRSLYGDVWLAPSLYDLQKWLRVKHNIDVLPTIREESPNKDYCCYIYKDAKLVNCKVAYGDDFCECMNDSLIEALKLI